MARLYLCRMFDVKEIFTAGMILFAVIDIIGSTPVIIGLRQKVGHIQSEKASLVALVIMIGFLFVGEEILNLIGIDVNSFAVAGSIIIFFLALEMILGIQFYKEESPETASIVPIAFPIIAGPGTLSTIISLNQDFSTVTILFGIVLNSIAIFIFLKSADFIQRKLGRVGLTIMERVFGIILIAIGMKILINALVLSVNYANNLI